MNTITFAAVPTEQIFFLMPQIIGDKSAIPVVPALIPVSRSTWLNGVKAGRYPQPVKISKRLNAWRRADILSLLAE